MSPTGFTFTRENDHDELSVNFLIFFIDLKKRSLYLKSSEGGFEISEHGRALVQSRGVFVEARLPHDRHARVELEGVVDSELRINDLLLGQ